MRPKHENTITAVQSIMNINVTKFRFLVDVLFFLNIYTVSNLWAYKIIKQKNSA